MIQPPLLAVSLPGSIDQGKVPWTIMLEKIRFQGNGDLFGKADTHETAGGDGITVPDYANGLFSGNHLSFFGSVRW
jgi:hypothetical protein